MEKKAAISSRRALSNSLLLAELVAVLILDSILKLLSLGFFTYCLRSFHARGIRLRNTSNEAEEDDKLSLTREDMEIITEKMGMPFSCDSEFMGFDEKQTSIILEEEEPSLEEVTEVFCLFDENRDGFIDAIELQRALCNLGYKEGANLNDCQQMIELHDENKDGKIDFNEFVRFMECSFNC